MDEIKSNAPRLRLKADIDFTKANPLCMKCRGTGMSGHKKIDNPESPSEKVDIPIICTCLTRSGGVKEDAMDRIMKEVDEQLDTGMFAGQLAKDIQNLPADARVKAINSLNEQLKDTKKEPRVLKAIQETLDILKKESN
jgi:hypothetical protein